MILAYRTLIKNSLKILSYRISAVETGLGTQTRRKILNSLRDLSKETIFATYVDRRGFVNISDFIFSNENE